MSFTLPFVLGQLSILLLLYLSLKFFLFAPSSPRHPVRRKPSSILRQPPSTSASSILKLTSYTIKHQAESLDWFNVLLAQLISHLRIEAADNDAVLTSLHRALNGEGGKGRPDWLEEITITDLSLGEAFPILSDCRVTERQSGPTPKPSNPLANGTDPAAQKSPGVETRMHISLPSPSATLTATEQEKSMLRLSISTRLLLNYPRPLTAILPVKLSVSIRRFEGTISVAFVAPSSPSTSPTPPTTDDALGGRVEIALLPDYTLDLDVRSLIGSRSKLEDVPKVRELVEGRVREWVASRVVWPRVWGVGVPRFWDKKEDGEAKAEVVVERRTEAVPLEERNGRAKEGGSEMLRRRVLIDGGSPYTMPGAMPDVGTVS